RLEDVRVAGSNVGLGAVVVLDVELTRPRARDVMLLAARASHNRLDAVRPPPAWLQGHASSRRRGKIHNIDGCLVGLPLLVGCVEALSLDSGHRTSSERMETGT